MDYTQITDAQADRMLETIGAKSVDELFAAVSPDLRVKGLLGLPGGLSEPELMADLSALSRKNAPCTDDGPVCFLGAGVYDHFIPAVVDDLASRSEFVTAYTPYQAEASQGALQAFYEFQTMICQLTGMEVANASLYEQASAVAEAVLMASAVTKRNRVLISSDGIHPDAKQVLKTLTYEQPIEAIRIDQSGGIIDLDAVRSNLDESVAAVVIQSPNFLGLIEPVAEVVRLAHEVGALVIQSADPVSCLVLKRPGDMDVDITVGEGQPLGIPMSYGGPFLGLFACREKYLRKMPGRIVGMTHDTDGKRGFCLALQTREQHIKRERATSNVCTNQGLLALRAAIYMATMGKSGLREQADQCLDKAHYAAERISQLDGYEMRFEASFFREFVIRATKKPVADVLRHCRSRNVLAGVALGRWYDALSDCFMVAVTEKRSRAEIDALVDALASV